jgi:hypothetical protein
MWLCRWLSLLSALYTAGALLSSNRGQRSTNRRDVNVLFANRKGDLLH